jgi:murein DD-endopeptidase MepM/ murein hydrolase activator NlpD
MNVPILRMLTLWSFKKELTYVALAFLFLLSLPIAAVFMLTNAGIDIVSGQLATQNTQTQSVDIHNPADGSVVQSINQQMEWPMHGVVTLEFGAIDLPYQPLHTGIDIANVMDTPITPFMDGTVTYAGEIFWGYGKHIIIDHGNNMSSLYGHLDKIYVYPGEKVHLGQIIGAEGETGWATGPHVHFEVRVYDIPVNPRTFLQGDP